MTRSPRLCAVAAPILALGLALGLSACTALHTPYRQPAVTIAPQWKHAEASAPAPAGDRWWRRFGDPQLDALVDRVLARDNDLAAAGLTMRRAQLQARYALVNPTVGATVTTSSAATLRDPKISSRTDTGSLFASYELDLFGALAAQKSAAGWEARATAQDLESTRLSLIAATVDDYFTVAFLNERVTLAEQSVVYAQKALDLVRVQARAGAASSLEVAEAAQNLASQQAGLHDLVEQRVEARTAIDLLLNGESQATANELPRLPQGAPPAVDAGLPASLLARRPDLRATELRLRERLASADQARLSFYPVLSLTGSLGGTSAALGQLLTHPVGTIGSELALPFLQFDQLKLAVGVSKANYEIAAVQFRQTLYQALTDVENALSAREQFAEQALALEDSLTNARTVERLDEVRYRAGSIPLQLWLDAQQTRRQAEAALAQNRLNRIETYVSLCKSLGGDAVRP
jgi:NodT family efflux transporter outer membrane factor (OMF) lipoprotein